MEQEVSGAWRTAAIVFIILFLLQTFVIVYVMVEGEKILETEKQCQLNVCREYSAYYYASSDKMCYCYTDNQIVLNQYMG